MRFIIILSLFISTAFSQQFVLSDVQLEELSTQKYLISRDKENKSGMIIFDVNRNIKDVMNDVLNLLSYPEKIEDVGKVEVYSYELNEVKAQIFIETFFINFDNYVIHDINKEDYIISWHLDDTKENYFAKMQGSWQFKEVGKKTRVFYKNKLEFKSWIPSIIESYLFEEGLFKSTQWLKANP